MRLIPSLPLLLLFVLLAGFAAWLQLGPGSGDRGMDNVMCYGAALTGAASYALWLVCRKGQSGGQRMRLVVLGLAAVTVTALTVRVDGWTGGMRPDWRFVWQSPAATQLASESVAATEMRDLASTTPYDFPGFLGPNRDATLPAVRLARDWEAAPPECVWRVPVGSGWSGFAIVNGVAFTQEQRGDQQLVVARDVETGAELWRTAHSAFFDHQLAGPGPRATPTVAQGLVYAHDTRGRLECLDAATGAARWARDLQADYGVSDELEARLIGFGRSPSPLVIGDVVVLPPGGDPAGRRAGLAGFDRLTGETVWEGPPRNMSHASPNIATVAGVRQILVVNEDSVSGHAPDDGHLLWEHPWPGETNAAASNSQPVPLAPDRVLVSKGYGQGAMMLRLTAAEDGQLTANEVWASVRALRTKFTNLVVQGEYAYALSDGILECVSLVDATRVWRDGRYGHGQLLLVGDLLLILSEEGELLLVEATPERENHVLGRVQALEGKTWNTLAVYRDLIVVRNGVEAAAWRVKLAP